MQCTGSAVYSESSELEQSQASESRALLGHATSELAALLD